jgi:transcriptional regulator with XRE-family HTH domain
MNNATEYVTRALKAARNAKALSQRGLAQLAGVPQSYVSRVERGAIDLRLSSLIEIARALDLELTLVPRKAAQAFKSFAKPAPLSDLSAIARASRKQLNEMQARLRELNRANPLLIDIAQFQRSVRDLQQFTLPKIEPMALDELNKKLEALKINKLDIGQLQRALSQIQTLRNQSVHANPDANNSAPAYQLDEAENE